MWLWLSISAITGRLSQKRLPRKQKRAGIAADPPFRIELREPMRNVKRSWDVIVGLSRDRHRMSPMPIGWSCDADRGTTCGPSRETRIRARRIPTRALPDGCAQDTQAQ